MKFLNVNSYFYKLLIFLIVISLSSSSITQNRFLQFFEFNDLDNNTNQTSNETDTSSFTEDPGTYLLGWFVIFFFMGLYIVCQMKKYPQSANKTDDVWKFMFFANNGILVAASVNVFNIKNLIIDSSPFALSSIVFIIGCIYYICKFCRTCSMQIANQYFECVQLGELYKLPCFIWSLVGLTDPCCRSNTYTVTYYSDGHTESDYCCHLIWNCVIYVIKRFAVIFTFMSYYIFLLFYLFFWFIAKLIFLCVLSFKREKEREPGPQQEMPNDNNNIQNDFIYNKREDPNIGTLININQNNFNQTEINRNLNRYQIDNNNIDNNFDNNILNIDNNHNSRKFYQEYLTLSPRQNKQSTENIRIQIIKIKEETINVQNRNNNNQNKNYIRQLPYDENIKHDNNMENSIENERNDVQSENERNDIPLENEINDVHSENERNDVPFEIEINYVHPENGRNDVNSESERHDVPSENEINKQSPKGDSQNNESKSYEIKNDELENEEIKNEELEKDLENDELENEEIKNEELENDEINNNEINDNEINSYKNEESNNNMEDAPGPGLNDGKI